MIFTALKLGARFKGGEIVPSFFTGAAFGCLFGNLSGFSPTLCTAVGMAAVFCGVTNCPITALLISFELFGYDGMPYFLLAVAFSYMLSGYYGLYSSQKIIYSKYKTTYINRKPHYKSSHISGFPAICGKFFNVLPWRLSEDQAVLFP